MKKIRAISLAALFLTNATFAQIHEIREMKEVLPYVDSQTWVVFDLDNTVMEPPQMLGSDQWFEYLLKTLGSLEQTGTQWMEVQKTTKMLPVEPTTPALIQDLQTRSARVFALTARPAEIQDTTLKQLDSIDVQFEKVISVGPTSSKGAALLEELRATQAKPRRIVFVDDKASHTRTVDQALSTTTLIHHEFRYGAADPKVRAFDHRIADIQHSFFETQGDILTDKEARQVLDNPHAANIRFPLLDAKERAQEDYPSEGGFTRTLDGCSPQPRPLPYVLITCTGTTALDLEGDEDAPASSWEVTYKYRLNDYVKLYVFLGSE